MKNEIERKIKESIEKSIFSHFDVMTITLKYSKLIGAGDFKSNEASRDFAKEILDCLRKGKNPGLNPCIDSIHEFFEEGFTGLDCAHEYVKENGEYETIPIDNNQSYEKITISLDILFVNSPSFLDKEKLEIIKAEIQTPLLKTEIK